MCTSHPRTSRTRWAPRTHRAAFTLIELLVVVAIISLLVSILLPSLNKARETARGVACTANLRQINIAFHMFADDNNGHLPHFNGTQSGSWWFGGQKSGAFAPELGLLTPYWGTAQIGGCPSFDRDDLRPQYGPVDYAYNDLLARRTGPAEPLGAKMVRAKFPTDTVLVFDSARLNNWQFTPGQLDRTPWGYGPSHSWPSFHGRHGAYGNAGWLDGHAESFVPVRFVSYPLRYTAAELEPDNLGDIDRDGNQSTDELFDLE